METIYRKVPVSERMPTKEGWYHVIINKEADVTYFDDNPLCKEDWIHDIEYWLEEIALPDEEEINKFIKDHPGNTDNIFLDSAVTAGFRTGIDWLLNKIKG